MARAFSVRCSSLWSADCGVLYNLRSRYAHRRGGDALLRGGLSSSLSIRHLLRAVAVFSDGGPCSAGPLVLITSTPRLCPLGEAASKGVKNSALSPAGSVGDHGPAGAGSLVIAIPPRPSRRFDLVSSRDRSQANRCAVTIWCYRRLNV